MSALDLLLGAKPDSERVHQAALKVLIEETPLLQQLTGAALPAPKVTWEPEKGAFDLLVQGAGGEGVLIEIKVDSLLTAKQIRFQLGHKAVASGNRPIYLLLGTSGLSHCEIWGQWRWILGGRPLPPLYDGDALRAAIARSVGEGVRPEVRELAEGYVRLLARLSERTNSYAGKSFEQFYKHDYFGYFDTLRRVIDFGGGSSVRYVSNKRGGFVCCAWEGHSTPLGSLYLQFEHQKLCLKLWAGELSKPERPQARETVANKALSLAGTQRFAGLGVKRTKGKIGKSMTLARFTKVELAPDQRDEKLLASLREAWALVEATAAACGGGSAARRPGS